ncbi:glycosyltransferase [Macrococcoides canis]|uniref:glycosyltransferase n=1 Tax=Macrococcoides canis TaxID=1855823 RepID=UPI001B8B70D9|nr:glycosyltransferase [Macrococcus canis]QUR93808.1 glycosyltransferase [Macrococcus canis]UTH07666.1 glycosyltransferase [Macrococcus canis]
MKIAILINNLAIGGAEKQVVNLANNLVNEHEVDVILLNSINSKDNIKKLHGVNINILSKNKRFSLSQLIKLKKLLDKKYDVVHAHLFPSFYYAAFLSKNKSNLIYTEHSVKNNRHNNIIMKKIDRYFLKKYNFITCVSEEAKEILINVYKLKKQEEQIHVIPNGISESLFKYKNNYKSDHIKITMVARFTDAKDYKTLINAFSKLNKMNLTLHLVGNGENYEETVKYVADNNFSNIKFYGYRNDVENILENTTIYVQSSKWESFGIAALEAMAAGIPVIHTNVDGLKDMISNESLRFNVYDEKGLIEIIEKLIEDKEFYENMSIICYNQAQKYKIKNVAKQYITLFEQNS